MEDGLEERIYQDLALRVRDRRAELNMSQQQAAALAGLTRSSLASIETGRQCVMLHQLYGLARALGTSPEALLPAFENAAETALDAMPREVGLFVASLQEASRPLRRKGA